LSNESPQELLSTVFGSYKAEWLRERLYDFFTEPEYFPELTTPRPCILMGGRGTGKTTVLRCLSYEGQFALHGRKRDAIASERFYGFYYRIDTNRVTAFAGAELAEVVWKRLFAHYFNLVVAELVLRFLAWYELNTAVPLGLGENACQRIAITLHLEECRSLKDLHSALDLAKHRFEATVNNVADGVKAPLSMQGAPIDVIFRALGELPQFEGKTFFLLIDEYENLLDYQQEIVNSLIKHSGEHYTFKVGVRELGLRRRSTVNPNEQLISPADYVRISVAEKLQGDNFTAFASSVCNGRIASLQALVGGRPRDIAELFPGLTEDEEAVLLGVEDQVRLLEAQAETEGWDEADRAFLGSLAPLECFFLKVWAEAQDMGLIDALNDCRERPDEWSIRYGNYKHSLLFALKQGKRGIRRYYAGWNAFTHISAANIRYLLELIEQSLLLHIRQDRPLTVPVAPETQTRAAQSVGKKNLTELEGLSVFGARLTKLVLSLGRVFQVMAEQSVGHAPEVNQFKLVDRPEEDSATVSEANDLLRLAVMHLALVRMPGSKLGDEGDTREYDYAVHPIFSPFFVFSYRKKRKMNLFATDLLGLVRRPKEAIREVLARSNRTDVAALPEQLQLFSGFYSGA
jgi:hypothetical protein